MQNLQPFHTFALPLQANQIIAIGSVGQLLQYWQQYAGQARLLLGQGSNVLFLEDFNGVVLLNRILGIQHREDSEYHYLHLGGGENWHQLVTRCVELGYDGLENLALIPGCVGSAPIQNIGAYGVEFKDVCEYVEVLDLKCGQIQRFSRADCQFGYRDSLFKHAPYDQDYAIVAVGLKLAKHWQPQLQYGSLAQLDPQTVSAKQIYDEVCAVRRSKLPDPNEFGNAGSFFKNPSVSQAQYQQLIAEYPTMPAFAQTDGTVKLAAGWLIDQCGLKGHQIGGAAVHRQQALVLINRDNAQPADVLELARYVRQQVLQKFRVALQPEVRFFDANGEIDSEQAIS
ncbi:UDP-N-acetylmuramate dehydrogenase [Pasteurellaceae bacterium USgator11]|nr:UDP-N-acetylmuramate dehydrogenase [Pasteurellaceae bacterium USgator41]TNG96685.1 UDP-N-acetylmuramate dehydrogenase [Pasteurellaceae bacterium UScroc12]TNG99745.1 UDP-N-acetylmuramate dehydrogenase [Pasteurellaceae bacterium USgator11]TNH01325.1 UDP-N-acetylmuramate dehydrogenase [Pasteurellaceae bacterium UScroc31]